MKISEILTEACWKGYHKEGMKTMFGKEYPDCVKNKKKKKTTEEITLEEAFGHKCPHCGGELVSEELVSEKQDACYHKVKGRYKVWPSAYASGALVQCRKKGAANWGNKSESVESIEEELSENLKKWFNDKWVRFGPDGKIKGDCARGDSSEGKPKCLPQSKAHALGKKGRASAGARKRRKDPDADRSGKAINVNTKKESAESVPEGLDADQKRVGQVGAKEKAKKTGTVLGTDPKQHPFKGRLVGEDTVREVAPPGMEDWIKDRKADFKQRYGDKWQQVLYATAWKQHNK